MGDDKHEILTGVKMMANGNGNSKTIYLTIIGLIVTVFIGYVGYVQGQESKIDAIQEIRECINDNTGNNKLQDQRILAIEAQIEKQNTKLDKIDVGIQEIREMVIRQGARTER